MILGRPATSKVSKFAPKCRKIKFDQPLESPGSGLSSARQINIVRQTYETMKTFSWKSHQNVDFMNVSNFTCLSAYIQVQTIEIFKHSWLFDKILKMGFSDIADEISRKSSFVYILVEIKDSSIKFFSQLLFLRSWRRNSSKMTWLLQKASITLEYKIWTSWQSKSRRMSQEVTT